MSSESDSDEDFIPGEQEQLSEEESQDEETDIQYEKEFEHNAKKRKAVQESITKKKRKTTTTRRGVKDPIPEPDEEKTEPEPALDPEEEKKREDDLWAKFLEGTDTKPKPAPKETNNTQTSSKGVETKEKAQGKDMNLKVTKNDEKARERRIFEFAGETIIVENNVIKEKIKSPSTVVVSNFAAAPSRGAGGLSNVLGKLSKKNQLSTLEKSKLDWETYKKEEGIEEEVQTHNKGKGGYLDRQDFLERADVRSYEIERDLRLSRRSNR